MLNLPTDLWYDVVEHINNRATILEICCVDTLGQVSLFLRTISTSAHPLKDFVQSLQIGQPNTLQNPTGQMGEDVAIDSRNILRLLPNLTELQLFVSPAALTLCLEELSPIFSLTSITCALTFSGSLWPFLENQKSITRIILTEENKYTRIIPAINLSTLPNLKSVSGSHHAVCMFSRLRRVSNITITSATWRNDNDTNLTLDRPEPFESITYFERGQNSRWCSVLQCIVSAQQAESLKTLRIVDSCTDGTLRNKPFPNSFVDLLPHFQALKEFTISRNAQETGDEAGPNTKQWLGDLADAETWRRVTGDIRIPPNSSDSEIGAVRNTTTTMLPLELWCNVIEHLENDHATLSTLCLINTYICELATSILYRSVTLAHSHTITSFLHTISTTTRSLSDMTTSLRVGEFRGDILQLRDVLRRLVNLRDLYLSDVWDTEQCLGDLNPPFSLLRLACQPDRSESFWSFLRTQSSINELKLMERETAYGGFILIGSVPSDILPNLKKISGPIYNIVAFFQNRPIFDVVLASGARGYINVDLVKALSQPPLESITSFEQSWETRWPRILELSFRENVTFTSLKKWSITTYDSPRPSREKPLPESCVDWLSRLEALEEFTIDKAGEFHREPILSTKEWLGELARPETWRRMMRNIRVVRIYDEAIIA